MKHRLSVIIAAHNEASTIGPLVRHLLQWHRKPEVIVVANGCRDGTARIAKLAGARVLRFDDKLGPDVGRAIGLSIARGDIFLVLDADILVRPAQLEPFVRAVERGVDVALNRYPFPDTKQFHHPTAIAKNALNIFADRSDLRAASLTAVPHALSRQAVNALGPLAFCVPAVAQARALCRSDLRVELAGRVHVGRLNRHRGAAHTKEMRRLIIGDCLEGMSVIIEERGNRAGFTDLGRRRDLAWQDAFLPPSTADVAVIIPTQGERNLPKVIRACSRSNIDHIRLVLNGTDDVQSDDYKGMENVQVDYYRHPVGHDVGRAIGCQQVDSEKYFFTDSDIPLKQEDVTPFLDALDDGVHLALNRLDSVLAKARQTDPPSIVKRFLNIALGRSDLGVSSLTAVPHAIRGEVLREIGADSLAVPPWRRSKPSCLDFAWKRCIRWT
ncbi:glycosyltransferase family 2 protein [Alicyclobacillus fastidiosus]|uniref:glycosyltransferase family 2 protein n=1 Tax=Alicyclobacillus fastidiosus TaxID=392011 RepID=UPI0023E99AA6|nr:glycosyltransferase family 2 protein [Alicyclobacillus fastidiosus]GMA63301.1 glycosyl transferase [Alicyclobacillus fastidiosus]